MRVLGAMSSRTPVLGPRCPQRPSDDGHEECDISGKCRDAVRRGLAKLRNGEVATLTLWPSCPSWTSPGARILYLTASIMAYDLERVLADIDANYDDCSVACLG